jgi:hypothetical protein
MTFERPDTIVVVDAVMFQVLRVAHNHCLLNDPVAREMTRVGIIRVLVESLPKQDGYSMRTPPAPPEGGEGQVYGVVGPPGDMLYCALAGHFYAVQHPCEAHPMLARLARATIERNRARAPGWAVAWQVVVAWGLTVQPWLAVTKLDEWGMPMAVCPEYEERLPL